MQYSKKEKKKKANYLVVYVLHMMRIEYFLSAAPETKKLLGLWT